MLLFVKEPLCLLQELGATYARYENTMISAKTAPGITPLLNWIVSVIYVLQVPVVHSQQTNNSVILLVIDVYIVEFI